MAKRKIFFIVGANVKQKSRKKKIKAIKNKIIISNKIIFENFILKA